MSLIYARSADTPAGLISFGEHFLNIPAVIEPSSGLSPNYLYPDMCVCVCNRDEQYI